MKSKEKESLKNLSAQELKNELRQTREKKMKLQFKSRMGSLPNPLEIRQLRRRVAKLETFLHQRETAAA